MGTGAVIGELHAPCLPGFLSPRRRPHFPRRKVMRPDTRSTGPPDLLFGPRFSLREAMTLILALFLATVLVPVGAKAAGSLVTLVDSATNRETRVGGTNSLTVATRPATSTTWYQQVTGPRT